MKGRMSGCRKGDEEIINIIIIILKVVRMWYKYTDVLL